MYKYAYFFFDLVRYIKEVNGFLDHKIMDLCLHISS